MITELVDQLSKLEETLSKQQWLGGKKPTQEDMDAVKKLPADFNRKDYPFTFAW